MLDRKTMTLMAAGAAMLLAVASANAAVVTVTSVTGHNNKDNFGGNMADLTSGSGMSRPDLNDPSTWTAITSSFVDEWQSGVLIANGINGKKGWVSLNFGSAVTGLDDLYIWNIREGNPEPRRVVSFNVYYATTPSVALPAAPTNNTAVDYDFASGGWTKLNVSPLTGNDPSEINSDPANNVVDLGGVTAQYLAIEILSNNGDANRTGFAELAVTNAPVPVIPEPSSVLMGIAGLALMALRRRS